MKASIKCLIILLAISFISACKKEDDSDSKTSSVNVYLTDAPATYDAVFIDVQDVAIFGSTSNEIHLNATPRIYNLLDLTNGVDTLIASGIVAAGNVSQIRLILGTNNSVVVNGVSHFLSTPSAQQSGLKIQVHREFLPNTTYNLILDFDAQASIVDEGNGSYSLKPVIKLASVNP